MARVAQFGEECRGTAKWQHLYITGFESPHGNAWEWKAWGGEGTQGPGESTTMESDIRQRVPMRIDEMVAG